MSFLEEISGSYFVNYQENGTKYLKNSRILPQDVLVNLNQCAGEIFLSGIPESASAEQIASIASVLGELYVLRFKVNFAGCSRGYAYMQYVNPALMVVAIQSLSELFAVNGLGRICVRESKNCSKLVLRNVVEMSPEGVEQTLRSYVVFLHLNARPLQDGKFDYQIVFGSNEEAVRARRIIITNISAFGRAANITWDRFSAK